MRYRPGVADRWRRGGGLILSELTWRLAESLGYPRQEDESAPRAAVREAPLIRRVSRPDDAMALLEQVEQMSDEDVTALVRELTAEEKHEPDRYR